MNYKLLVLITAVSLSQSLYAQENEAIVRRFTPSDSDIKSKYECIYHRDRFTTLAGYLVLRKNRFKHSLIRSTHIPHGKGFKTKLLTSRGKSLTRNDSLVFVYNEDNRMDEKFATYIVSAYSVVGMEFTTVSDLPKNILYRIIFLIPKEKAILGEEIINDFFSKVTEVSNAENNLTYIGLYIIARKQLLEIEGRFRQDEVFVFEREY
jgi:hypothetical protein